MDGYFVVYGHGGFVFKDEQIIILADLPGTQDKTCIIMTKIQFEKMFLINPFNPTQMQTIKLMNWARKTHTEKFGIAVNEILETNYSSNKLKN